MSRLHDQTAVLARSVNPLIDWYKDHSDEAILLRRVSFVLGSILLVVASISYSMGFAFDAPGALMVPSAILMSVAGVLMLTPLSQKNRSLVFGSITALSLMTFGTLLGRLMV